MDIDDAPLDPDFYDFSGDDFAGDKEIQKIRKEEAAFNKMMNDCISMVTHAFGASPASHRNLKHFLLHKSVHTPFVRESYEGRWKQHTFYFCIFQYSSSVHAGRLYNSGTDHYFAGLINLGKTYPHTIGQPETLALKLENLVLKTDVDFSHAKKFSRRFHVICKDREALQTLLFNKDLNRLAAHPDAEFELNEKQCYFRPNRKPISPEVTTDFIGLVKVLLELL